MQISQLYLKYIGHKYFLDVQQTDALCNLFPILNFCLTSKSSHAILYVILYYLVPKSQTHPPRKKQQCFEKSSQHLCRDGLNNIFYFLRAFCLLLICSTFSQTLQYDTHNKTTSYPGHCSKKYDRVHHLLNKEKPL